MCKVIRLFILFILFYFSSIANANCTIDVKYINGINNSSDDIEKGRDAIKTLLYSRSEICSVEALSNHSYGILNDLKELEIGKANLADNWWNKTLAVLKGYILSPFSSSNTQDRYNTNLDGMKKNVQASYDAGRNKVIIITHSEGADFGKALRIYFQGFGKSIQVFYIAPPIDISNDPGCDKTKTVTDICYIFSTADNVISLVSDRPFINFAATSNQNNFLSGHSLLDYYLNDSSTGEWNDDTVYGNGSNIKNSSPKAMILKGVGYMINHPPIIWVK